MSGTRFELRRLADADAVCHDAAETFCRAFDEAAGGGGRFRIGLSGGSTPRRFHEILAAPPWRERVDWRRVDFFWGDERGLPPDHPDSNYRMALESLLEPLGIEADQVHRMQGETEDLEAAALAYQSEIAAAFGADPTGPPPRFDLLIHGMGSDGHTASLFPGGAALGEGRRWVVAEEVAAPGAAATARRLTLTLPLINAAARVLFLVTGAGKAHALAEVLEGPRDPQRLPAQAIRPADGALLWLVDEAAAGELRDA